MAELKLKLLGDMQVELQGERLKLPPSKKTRALLAYLALSTRPHRRESLCELLWEVPDDPRGSLRWSLSKIRKLVDTEGQPRIIADRSQVGFAADTTQIDSQQLQLFAAGDLKRHSLEALQQAQSQFRGDFLEGLELPNFHDFYAWCVSQREAVIRDQAKILEALITRIGDQQEAVLDYSRKLVTIMPYDEQARARYIRQLKLHNRVREAEQQFNMGQKMLRELGAADSGLLLNAWRSNIGSNVTPAPERESDAPIIISPSIQPTTVELLDREQEISSLYKTFNKVQTEHHAQLVLIEGEPGIGKSALLQKFEQSLVDKCQWLKASAYEPEMIRPFAIWHDALSNAGNMELLKLFKGEGKINREQIFEGLAELVTQLASKSPLVILFDDVQWCDESSAALIHYIFRSCQSLPLLLVLAVRSAELKENAPLTQIIGGFRHEGNLSEIPLHELDDESIRQLIKSQAPDADTEQLIQDSGGNPLFAIELARANTGGSHGESLSDLVNSRLARQEDSVIEVLRWASVISPIIQLSNLEQLCDISQHQLDQAIEAGVQQGILTHRNMGLEFSHELVARAVYNSISPARRQTMHRRVAEQLEIATSQDLQLAAELARHAQQSGDAALAARSMVQAALLCLRFYAYEEAVNLSQKGLRFAEHLSEAERIAITIECLEIQLTASPPEDWEAAAEHYKELAEQALDHGAMSHARRGYQMASYVKWSHGQWADAQRESMQAERISRRGDELEHITGLAETAKCLALLERDLPSADAMLMEADALAKRHTYYIGAIPAGIGIIRYLEGRFQEAEELLLDAQTIFKSEGDRLNEFQANEYLTMIAIENNDFDKALFYCRPLLKLAEKLPNGSEMPFALGLEALCKLALDESQDESSMQGHFEALRIVDAKQRLAYLLNRAALIMLKRKKHQQALAWADEAYEAAKCLSRYSEMLLAKLIQFGCEDHTTGSATSKQQLHALRDLYQKTSVNWAKEQVGAMLVEKGVI